MTEKDRYTLGDDLPKENPWTEDRLDFAPFTKRLATVIRSLQVPNGYVIGLHGEWGSGKSTALNFVNEYLKKHNQETTDGSDRVCPIDFRPWIIAGHQDLIAGFFKIMAESIGKKPGIISRIVNRLFRSAKMTAAPLLDALATVALVIDPSGGAASKAVTTVAKKSVAEMIDRFLAEPSLQKAYENLKKALTDTGKRFLVTIDYLDRLHAHERSYPLHKRPDETLYDLQTLKDATVRHSDSSELSQDECKRIRALSEGVERLLLEAEAATQRYEYLCSSPTCRTKSEPWRNSIAIVPTARTPSTN